MSRAWTGSTPRGSARCAALYAALDLLPGSIVNAALAAVAGLSAGWRPSWYADMVRSPAKDEFEQRLLGLPAHLLSTSPLTCAYAELRRVLATAGRRRDAHVAGRPFDAA